MMEPVTREAILAEQVRHLYRLSRPAYAASLVNAGIVVFVLWGIVANALLIAWLAAMIAVIAARFALYRSYASVPPPPGEARAWAKRFIIGAGTTGVLWGVVGSALYPAASMPHQFLVIFLIGGMVLSAMVILAPVRQAFLAYMLPPMALVTATVFAQGTTLHLYMGLLLLVFIGVMLGTAPVLSEMMRESLRVTFENSTLVEQLSRANRELSERVRRGDLETAVTALLADARSIEEVMPRLIQTMCEGLDYVYGARWVLDGKDRVLRCAESWCVADAAVEEFRRVGSTRLEVPGKPGGLNRRVWATSAPVWLADVAQDATLWRREPAGKAGLRSAFAFPIMVGGEFYGVMEFFGRPVRARDDKVIELAQTIGSQIGQFVARKQAEDNLQFFASHDPLTGLFNRTMFSERLQQALAQAQRFERTLALLFIDLDGFKLINDTLGHNAGDTLLVELGARLRGVLREGDVIARMGGDEFVVLIEEFGETAQVVEVAKKLLETISRPFSLHNQEHSVTASIGVSACPDDGRDASTLLKNADIAMYRAKEGGKNNFRFFAPEMNVHLAERLSLESGLKRALERGELRLAYQPKVNLRSGNVAGIEALVRWQHPAQGTIGPQEFVPIAEDTGLINAIGAWVLRTACEQARAWHDQGLPSIRMAVNLSARQFSQDNLIQVVREALHNSALDPARLELEITESMVIRNPERAVKMLEQLRELGVRVTLDDFGTGYSSLGYLMRCPVDCVKLDRSFVLKLPGDIDSATIARAVIAMAHSMKLQVTAEGVETREQQEFLRDLGCDEMQGNHFSEPVAADAVPALLRQPLGGGRRATVQLLHPRRGDGSDSQQ